MGRTATGAITLTDVADGGSPISAVMSNENHSFAAAASTGEVSTAEKSAFSSLPQVFIGTTTGTYKNSTVTTASADINKFSIGTIDSSSTGWSLTKNNSTGALTMNALPTGTSNKSTTMTVPITVNDGSSNLKAVTLKITLNKAIEGIGGAIIILTANKQYFQYDADTNLAPAVQSDIIIDVETQGIVGALTSSISVDGGSWGTLSQGTGADQAKTIATGTTSITISSDNFDDSNTISVKVAGATGGSDSLSIVRVRDGIQGNSALVVTLVSNDGNVFKNNAGADKTITAKVLDMRTGGYLTHVGTGSGQLQVNYNWQRADAGGTATDVQVSSGTRDVVSSGGVSADGDGNATIVVGPVDIADNSSTQFECEVTVTQH